MTNRFLAGSPRYGLRTIEDVLFPGVDVELERLIISPELLVIEAARREAAEVPGLRDAREESIHSSYWRILGERPAIGRKLTIRLRVRRYFCDRKPCGRLTFVEQVEGLSERYRRSSLGLKQWLRAVAVGPASGCAGQSASASAAPACWNSWKRRRYRPARHGCSAKFAFRKGRTYGTVLVDIEARTVVDVLPDRTSETFAAWLREHLGVEIVCRDRATAYTKAVKEAAPDAIEVADRWHLLQNHGAAVEKTCQQHRACLRKQAEQHEPAEAPAVVLPMTVLPKTPIVDRARERHEDVHRLLDRGWTISVVARHLQLDRKTVRRYGNTPLDELLASAKDFGAHRRHQLQPFMPYLHIRYAAGITSGRQLFDEIHERGYTGSIQVLRTPARRDHRTNPRRPGQILPRPAEQPSRPSPAGVDPGRTGGPGADPVLRRLPAPGP
ncbi:transposase [Streptacidiphilus sp. MAP12-20]|uniref:transposase n=1 Tax=Streptacidiphilus sp. MAP12-20 TaxID=3156299 RepID=UPI003513C6A4